MDPGALLEYAGQGSTTGDTLAPRVSEASHKTSHFRKIFCCDTQLPSNSPCPDRESRGKYWAVYESSLCLVDTCRIFSHLSASIILTFSLLSSVLTSRQRLESEICLIIWFFPPPPLSFRKGGMELLVLCVELPPSERNVCLGLSCRGIQRWRGTEPLGWCMHPHLHPTLMELNSYMSFWEVKPSKFLHSPQPGFNTVPPHSFIK